MSDHNVIFTLVVLFLLLLAMEGRTQTAVQISNARGDTQNFDEITTSNGAKCRQAMGSNLNVEMGVGQFEEQESFVEEFNNNNNNTGQAALFGRITYAIGAPKRLDCSRFYELELMKLRQQIINLQK